MQVAFFKMIIFYLIENKKVPTEACKELQWSLHLMRIWWQGAKI